MSEHEKQVLNQESRVDLSHMVPEEPARFTEKGFAAYIVELCKMGKHDVAERYYLSHLDKLLASGVNPKEKLNHLVYLSRMIQSGSGLKHGYQKLLRKVRGLRNNVEIYELLPGGFVEFGCGAHDPIALSTLYYLNGFRPCYAIDLMKPRSEMYSALSMYDIMTNVHCFPERYCFTGTGIDDIRDRLRLFDLAAFEAGDFWGGFERIKGEINYEPGDILESDIDNESISLFSSFAVLEHVDDLESVCRKIHQIVRPGGIVFHFVDLADHRVYRRDPQFNTFTFLTEENPPKGMNRLRASEIIETHRRHGFEILEEKRKLETIPDETRQRLLPKFRRMPLEDVSVTKLNLVVRRAG